MYGMNVRRILNDIQETGGRGLMNPDLSLKAIRSALHLPIEAKRCDTLLAWT